MMVDEAQLELLRAIHTDVREIRRELANKANKTEVEEHSKTLIEHGQTLTRHKTIGMVALGLFSTGLTVLGFAISWLR